MKKLTALGFLIIMLACPARVCAAFYDAPYASYTYDTWNRSVASPQCYLPEAVYLGAETGADAFKSPQDIAVSPSGAIFVADTGNARIVVLDENYQMTQRYDEMELTEPTGLFCAKEKFYIADKSGKVLVADYSGQILLTIETPQHALIAEDFTFMPVKVAADRAGKIYVLAYGCYYGLMQFSPSGEFLGYYGANPVQMTPELYAEYLWKQVMSQEQRESMMRLLPVEYSNVTAGTNNFIYTTTISADTNTNQIKKLNPSGNNILLGRNNRELRYGDLEYDLNKDKQVRSAFTDVAVGESGLIFGLDQTRKRVFVYDSEGEMIGVFGGQGNQKGTFQQPSAIEIREDKILVLDTTKNNITVFAPTEYMTHIKEGLTAYRAGDYVSALTPWEYAAAHNANGLLAWKGIGKSLARQDEYISALEAFKRSGSRILYSEVFADYRLAVMRSALPALVAATLGAAAVWMASRGIIRRVKRKGAHP